MIKRFLIITVFITMIVITFALAGCGVNTAEIGGKAPDFKLKDLSGKEISLKSLRGKPVILNFWATTCPYCVEEMPDLEKYHREFGSKVEVIGIDLGEKREVVKEFIEEGSYTYKILLDPEGVTGSPYKINAIPVTYFIDKEGVVKHRIIGMTNYEQLIITSRSIEVIDQ